MCGSGNAELDALILETFRKYPSLVHFNYRKSAPTFNGLPQVFAELQRRGAQRVKDRSMIWNMTHARACLDLDA